MSTLAAHSMMALKSQRSRLQTPSDSLSTVDSYAHRGSTFAGSQEPAPPAILDPINHLSPQIPRESSPVAQVAELLPPVEQTDPASHRYVASRVIHDVSKSTTSPFRTIAYTTKAFCRNYEYTTTRGTRDGRFLCCFSSTCCCIPSTDLKTGASVSFCWSTTKMRTACVNFMPIGIKNLRLTYWASQHH
ncbi:hypothetical protein RhiJN_11744 [Ceratobasidium sp. AG-Ba]|nr:hypothetical protein RhiJN_11744 [Ceratobasidium sp. AG-Ba]